MINIPRNKRIVSGAAAFTLAEVLVSVFILSLLISAIYGVLNVGNKLYLTDMALLDLQQQARQAMYGMVRELRQTNTNPAEGNIIASGSEVTFSIPPAVYADADGNPNPWIGPISYYRDVNDSNNDELVNQIIREYPYPATSEDDFRILANDITSLNFSPSGNILEICLAAKRTVGTRELCFPAPCQSPAKTLKETIMLRN